MPRLSRKLRVCKWVGTLGCALLLAAAVWSGWFSVSFKWDSNEVGRCCSLKNVVLEYWQNVGWTHPPDRLGWDLKWSSPPVKAKDFSPFPESRRSDYGDLFLRLPLSLPFLVLLVPTLLLWRCDCHKLRPGFCRGCDYDLTSNTTGRCPECGLEISQADALSAARQRERSAAKPRLSRRLRVCKWACTLGCVLVAAVFAGSKWWELEYRWNVGSECKLAWLGKGGVFFSPIGLPRGKPGWHLLKTPSSEQRWAVWHLGSVEDSAGYYCVILPLWYPFLVFLTPMVVLWRRDLRGPARVSEAPATTT